ncbi:MAG: DeoR family transcriptional regulator [Candidatus Sungbacteria bacterium]|nr:DeoR family transcriptional regulator [Candidatus Sungbacteria bacterium]
MKTSQELHRKTFELTLALYRVTDFFPQGEALKRQLREKANEIFGCVTEYGYTDRHEQETLTLLGRVETIKGYLRVSRSMRFVRPINLTILEREYEFLEHFFRQELTGNHVSYDEQEQDVSGNKTKLRIAGEDARMTDRQKKILTFVEKVSQAKISDFYALLTGVSAKTIQRDLHDLVQKNILKKDGRKRWTSYSLL